MTEIKFSCPHCGQHIECDDSYSGQEIPCPTCQKSIVVPHPPGTAAPAGPPAAPKPPAGGKLSISKPQAEPASAAEAASSAPAASSSLPPPRIAKPEKSTLALVSLILSLIGMSIPAIVCGHMAKSRIRKNPFLGGSGMATAGLAIGYTLLALQLTAVIAAVFFFGSVFHAVDKEMRQASAQSAQAANGGAASTNGPTAQDLIKKASAQMRGLSSYSASSKCELNMDMSKVDPSSIPGTSQMKNDKDFQKNVKDQLKQFKNMSSDIEVKLAKPDLYRIEWVQSLSINGRDITNKGAAWSAGEGQFILLPNHTYSKLPGDVKAGLATSSGLSGFSGNGIFGAFFADQNDPIADLKNPAKAGEETIDGEDCYRVKGTAMGQKMELWIAKETFLIKQQQITFGGEMPQMSDADVDKALKASGQDVTPEKRAQMRETMKGMKSMVSNMKGSALVTYSNIETNKSFAKEDFKYPLPPGAKEVNLSISSALTPKAAPAQAAAPGIKTPKRKAR